MSGNSDAAVSQTGVELDHKPIETHTDAEPQNEQVFEPEIVADPEVDELEETAIRSNKESPSESGPYPELANDQGNRTFTMRELLDGLKTDQGNDVANDTTSSYRSGIFLGIVISSGI